MADCCAQVSIERSSSSRKISLRKRSSARDGRNSRQRRERVGQQAEAGDVLRKHGRGGRARNAPVKDQHEQQVKPDVQKCGNPEKPERRDGISDRAQQAREEIINGGRKQSGKNNQKIGAHIGGKLRRDLQKQQDFIEEQIDRRVQQQRHAEDQPQRVRNGPDVVAEHTRQAQHKQQHAVDGGGLLPAPAEGIHADGEDVLENGNHGGEAREDHEQEEQRPPESPTRHVDKDVRKRLENERRAVVRLQCRR